MMNLRKIIFAALLAACMVGAAAQTSAPPLTVCADPYPLTTVIDGAKVQVDGQAVPGALCGVKPVAGGIVPTCQIPRTALGEGVRSIGLAGCQGSRCSPYATRNYRLTLTGCGKPDPATSRMSCSWQFAPEPQVPMGTMPCGEAPPAQAWAALGGSVYAVQADGAMRLASPLRRVAAGSACNCASPRLVSGVNYCPFSGGGASEITACKVAP